MDLYSIVYTFYDLFFKVPDKNYTSLLLYLLCRRKTMCD